MSDYIYVEGQRHNINLLLKRLKYDMKDDWFQDTLNYTDALRKEQILAFFKQYKKSPSKQYSFIGSELYNIPKEGFTLRYSQETNIYDRIVYQALAGHLIQYYDRIHSPCVYSHRWSKQPKGRYIFKNNIEAWKTFGADITHEFNSSSNNVLVVTDIMNFYENIHVKYIHKALQCNLKKLGTTSKETEAIKKSIKMLNRGLKKWAGQSQCGIPQNRDASSFLGNILLHSVDNIMSCKQYKYFRYMDDIRIICSDVYEARRALKELIISLREIGLNVNAKKTIILPSDNPKVAKYLANPIREIEQIDQLLKSKNLINIRKAIPLLKNLTLRYIRKNKTQESGFRFCLNRIVDFSLCNETKKLIASDKITTTIIAELVN